jgi:hypothetical protein
MGFTDKTDDNRALLDCFLRVLDLEYSTLRGAMFRKLALLKQEVQRNSSGC